MSDLKKTFHSQEQAPDYIVMFKDRKKNVYFNQIKINKLWYNYWTAKQAVYSFWTEQ